MSKADEIIAAGISALSAATSDREWRTLVELDRRRTKRATAARRLVGAGVLAVILAVVSLALRPESAMAALKEAARATAAQPYVHLHVERQDTAVSSAGLPWPAIPHLDIWRFPDRYVRKEGHVTYEAFRSGYSLAYDDRFDRGLKSSYDPSRDSFWKFDGTISLSLSEPHKDPPFVQSVEQNGSQLLCYEWNDSGNPRSKGTSDIFVDPKSELVRGATDYSTDNAGYTSRSWSKVDYPSASEAEAAVPRFPNGLRFDTKEKLLSRFNATVGEPDSSQVIGGVRVTLYGVIVSPNVPDGLGILAITKGGAGPDFGSPESVSVEGSALLSAKRSQWLGLQVEPSQVRPGSFPVIAGKRYVALNSEDLLIRAPKSMRLRVPVWRQDSSGRHVFLGYAKFQTSKIYCNPAMDDWNFFR